MQPSWIINNLLCSLLGRECKNDGTLTFLLMTDLMVYMLWSAYTWRDNVITNVCIDFIVLKLCTTGFAMTR